MIYEYRCPNCEKKTEIILRVSDVGNPQHCSCGAVMEKLISLPQPAIIVVTNRDKVVRTLNDEQGGYSLPGAGKHGARYKSVMADGLTRPKPVIGRGFG